LLLMAVAPTQPPSAPAPPGPRLIDAGRGYGRACWKAVEAATAPTSSPSWMAMAPMIREHPGSDQANRGGEQDFVIGSRVRGEREREACLASGWRRTAGRARDAGALWDTIHRHVRLSRDSGVMFC